MGRKAKLRSYRRSERAIRKRFSIDYEQTKQSFRKGMENIKQHPELEWQSKIILREDWDIIDRILEELETEGVYTPPLRVEIHDRYGGTGALFTISSYHRLS
jgi:hypothetical protein